MYHKKVGAFLLVLSLIVLTSVSAFAADTDLSANYTAASVIYASCKETISGSTSQQAEIVKQLDRASTFLASDRSALISANGFAVPAEAPVVLMENRQALAELIAADGYSFTDYLKTMTVRIPQDYSLNYGTFSIARSTLQDALNAGFTDVIFQNDLCSLRLSMIDYLPLVPETVTTLRYFIGETRTNVPQAALDIAKSLPVLVFREYRDGVMVANSNYTKNAVALVVNSAMYNMSGYSPSENLFYKFNAVTGTAVNVSGYLYSTSTKAASFAIEDGNYFLFLAKPTPSVAYEFVGDGYGLYNVNMAENTFTADLFFENACAAGSAVAYLVFYDENGAVTQGKTCEITPQLGQSAVTFELDHMNDTDFSMFIWRSSETIQPLFGKVSGTV